MYVFVLRSMSYGADRSCREVRQGLGIHLLLISPTQYLYLTALEKVACTPIVRTLLAKSRQPSHCEKDNSKFYVPNCSVRKLQFCTSESDCACCCAVLQAVCAACSRTSIDTVPYCTPNNRQRNLNTWDD